MVSEFIHKMHIASVMTSHVPICHTATQINNDKQRGQSGNSYRRLTRGGRPASLYRHNSRHCQRLSLEILLIDLDGLWHDNCSHSLTPIIELRCIMTQHSNKNIYIDSNACLVILSPKRSCWKIVFLQFIHHQKRTNVKPISWYTDVIFSLSDFQASSLHDYYLNMSCRFNINIMHGYYLKI